MGVTFVADTGAGGLTLTNAVNNRGIYATPDSNHATTVTYFCFSFVAPGTQTGGAMILEIGTAQGIGATPTSITPYALDPSYATAAQGTYGHSPASFTTFEPVWRARVPLAAQYAQWRGSILIPPGDYFAAQVLNPSGNSNVAGEMLIWVEE